MDCGKKYEELKNRPMKSRDADMAMGIPKLQLMDRARGELIRLSSAPIPAPFEENGRGHWLSEMANDYMYVTDGQRANRHLDQHPPYDSN